MNILDFVIISLATCRVGSLLAREPGPYDILDRLRYFVGVRYDELNKPHGTNVVSKMMLCMYCNTIWIGLVFTVLYLAFDKTFVYVCLPLSLSAAALIVDNIS